MSRPSNRRQARQKPTKQKPDPTVLLALSIVPAAQVANGTFTECNVANHSDKDQRHSVRSKEVKTIRRKSHIDILVNRRTLTPRQGQLCQWYADQHEIGFATVGCIANYLGAGGGGFGAMDLLARYSEQSIARANYAEAKQSISHMLLTMFERVVLGRIGLGEAGGKARHSRLSLSFRLAVDELERGIGHLVTER